MLSESYFKVKYAKSEIRIMRVYCTVLSGTVLHCSLNTRTVLKHLICLTGRARFPFRELHTAHYCLLPVSLFLSQISFAMQKREGEGIQSERFLDRMAKRGKRRKWNKRVRRGRKGYLLGCFFDPRSFSFSQPETSLFSSHRLL